MKKIAKLSLVTAVMVAGLTNVNAASLEESIKNVDISGQFRFRANDKSDQTGTVESNDNGTDVEIEIGLKVPVTDNVTAVFKIDNANDDKDSVTKGSVNIEDYYFSYANNGTTVNFGQQNIPGRMTDGAQGDGIVALQTVGDFTIGAAAFQTNSVHNNAKAASVGIVAGVPAVVAATGNDISAQDVYSIIALGNVGPVSLLGQYANVKDTLDAYNVKADVKIDMISAGLEYTETELDSTVAAALGVVKDDRSTFKAYVAAKAGIVSAKLSYAKTGDNGSGSIDNQLHRESETASELLLWNIGSGMRVDAEMYVIDASVAVTDKISLRAAYLGGEEGNGANNDLKETLAQVSYKVAKNLNTYVRFADVEDKGNEYTRGRVEVKYSF